MLFKRVRVGDEVILASPGGHGVVGGFTHTLTTVSAVKTTALVADGFQFNMKDGHGRTTRHQLYPATAENRRQYLDGDETPDAAVAAEETEAEVKLRRLAHDGLRIIREEADASRNDDVAELIGVEVLAAFRRQWRKLHPTK